MSVVSQAIPLEFMDAGDRAVVLEIDGRSDLVVRLEEMGLHAGAKVRMIRPGTPCIIEVNHHRFSFRFDDALELDDDPPLSCSCGDGGLGVLISLANSSDVTLPQLPHLIKLASFDAF